MILKADRIARELEDRSDAEDLLIISPKPNIHDIRSSGAASLDVRLGRWFLTCRPSRIGMLDVYKPRSEVPSEAKLTKSYYVPFGEGFVLHPKAFVLGVTMEWFRLPADMAAYVVGRSSWGRHGLVIATASGVHPGFTGCLTLELANIGEIPVTIRPGTTICQVFFHKVEVGDRTHVDRSNFIGRRKPTLGHIELDRIAESLAEMKDSHRV